MKGDKDRGAKYQVDVVFSLDDPAWAAWATDIKKRSLAVGKNVPIRRELVKDANGVKTPTGLWHATFKTSERFKPKLFDDEGHPIDVMVGNGSKVRVNYTPAAYEGLGGGITLYLNAVQVVELVEYVSGGRATDYGFVESPRVAETAVPAGLEDEWETAPESGNDELPF
jgi:hypothetical protein